MINLLLKNKNIISSAFYLSLVEIVRMCMPFLALPYIFKTVGAEKYGIVVFAQAIVSYFSVFINFGLDISAVREVSINRHNKGKLNEIVSSILIVKSVLFFLSLLVFTFLIFVVPVFKVNFLVFVFAFAACIADVLFPLWFFQGVEKLNKIVLIRLFSILFYIVCLFNFVVTKGDYYLIPLFQSLGLILSGVMSILVLVNSEKISIYIPKYGFIHKYFKESIPFFSSRISIVVNNTLAKIVSGFFFSMNDVAVFDLAQKICTAAFVPIQMLNQAIFPHNSKNQDKKFASDLFGVVLLITFLISSLVYIFAPFIVNLFTHSQLSNAIFVLRLLCVYIFFGGISLYTGSPVLVAFGYPKPFNYSVIISTFVLMLIYVLFYFSNNFSIYSFAIALGLAEISVSLYRLYFCFNLDIFRLRLKSM